MGQKPSNLGGSGFNTNKHHHHHSNQLPLKLSWLFRRHHNQQQQQQQQSTTRVTRNPNPEQPIRFHYKTTRRNKHFNEKTDNLTKNFSNTNNLKQFNNNFDKKTNHDKNQLKNTNLNDVKCRIIKTENLPIRTKSEPNLIIERSGREKQHRHRKRTTTKQIRNDWADDVQQFGYEIEDVDAFLTKATIEKPANIPVVLAFPSILYQTRIGGYQAEISLPLGMVVNAVFKNQHWLYVQTPHAEEGYVSYAACLPLGIIPPPDDDDTAAAAAATSPCWDNSTDVFPKPSGNMTDTEKLSSKSDGSCRSRRSRNAISICGERSVDRLYLRATSTKRMKTSPAITRQTLLFITNDYNGSEKNALHVRKGDVVVLLGTHIKGWFWVKNKDGAEGFIPAAVAGHGFL